ncbi:MAG: hypothetical protein R2770_20570 [Acidimicrobiales bacterium]
MEPHGHAERSAAQPAVRELKVAQQDPRDWLRDSMAMWRDIVPGIAEPMTAGMIQMADVFGVSPAKVFAELVAAARSDLVGKELSVEVGSTRVDLVLDDITTEVHSLGPAVGQFGDITLSAHDVLLHGVRIAQAKVGLQNVHLRPGTPMVLVAAPVQVEVRLAEAVVAALVSDADVGVSFEIVDAKPRVRSLGRPAMGYLEVELAPAVDHVMISAVAASNDRWRLERGLRRLPSVRFDLPRELRGVIKHIEVEGDGVVLRGNFDQLAEPVSRAQIDQVLRRLQTFTGDRLRIPRI